MARKSFKGYVSPEVVEFDLEPPNGGHTFTVRGVPMIPGSVLLDFLSDTKGDDPGSLAAAINSILKAAVVPEQWDEFRAYTDNPENGISLEILSEMAGYLAESYSGRPTSPSAPSMAG